MAADASLRVESKPNSGIVWITTLVLLALMFASAAMLKGRYSGLSWAGVATTMFVFFLCLGVWICGRPLGVLVSERNVMSLARLQMVLWTLIILSAYLTLAVKRIHAGIPDPLGFTLDWRLWALMGISTVSLVGSPLLLEPKKQKEATGQSIDTAAAALKEDSATIQKNSAGTLYSNASIRDARLTDVFQGDEISNTAYIDVAKLQMFFFTMVAGFSYCYLVFAMFMRNDPAQLAAMPALPEGLIAILGVSHAGYLSSKTVDHTPAK